MTLINKEIIRKEIERRIKLHYKEGIVVNADRIDEDEIILAFLDSLPAQPVEGLGEKDFVEEVRQYYSNNCTWDALKQPMLSIITRCARHFAEWGAEHLKK